MNTKYKTLKYNNPTNKTSTLANKITNNINTINKPNKSHRIFSNIINNKRTD